MVRRHNGLGGKRWRQRAIGDVPLQIVLEVSLNTQLEAWEVMQREGQRPQVTRGLGSSNHRAWPSAGAKGHTDKPHYATTCYQSASLDIVLIIIMIGLFLV